MLSPRLGIALSIPLIAALASEPAHAFGRKRRTETAPIASLRVEIPSGYHGAIVVRPSKGSEIVRELRGGTQEVSLPQVTEIKGAQLEIRSDLTRNLPEGVSRSIYFNARYKLEKKNGIERIVLDGKPGVMTADQSRNMDCSSLFSGEIDSVQATLRFSGFRTLLDCRFKDSEYFDVAQVGTRYVSKIGSALHRNFYSEEQDIELGREFTREFTAKNDRYILSSHHPVSRFFQERMERIARNSDSPRLRPRVFVINANILNAFALPGGDVYVFRGLIDAARSESEVMGVLGHEWAHVTARHGTNGMSRIIGSILWGEVGKALIDIAAGKRKKSDLEKVLIGLSKFTVDALTQLYILNKSREQESQADLYGAQYAYLAGFEPHGVGDMFTVFKQKSGNREWTSLEKLLSTHPDHTTRINNNYIVSALFMPEARDSIHTSAEFERMRRELDSLPKISGDESALLGPSFASGVNAVAAESIQKKVLEHTKSKE